VVAGLVLGVDDQSMKAIGSWRTGDPSCPAPHPDTSKRSPVLAPKAPARLFLVVAHDVDGKVPAVADRRQVVDEWAMHTSTSGGSSDTDVKELGRHPDGRSGPWPVTTVTPVAKCPRTVRKRALSTPSSEVSGVFGI